MNSIEEVRKAYEAMKENLGDELSKTKNIESTDNLISKKRKGKNKGLGL